MKTTVEYRVTSGSPDNCTKSYNQCGSLKMARSVKKDNIKSNPHQGGGYHIVKVTSTFKTIK